MKEKRNDDVQRREVLDYLSEVLRKERPGRSVRAFLVKARAVSTDDLVRIADAIQRFGLDNLLMR